MIQLQELRIEDRGWKIGSCALAILDLLSSILQPVVGRRLSVVEKGATPGYIIYATMPLDALERSLGDGGVGSERSVVGFATGGCAAQAAADPAGAPTGCLQRGRGRLARGDTRIAVCRIARRAGRRARLPGCSCRARCPW